MSFGDLSLNFFINLAAGVVGIFIVLWIERQRRAKLYMTLGQSGYIASNDPLERPEAKWPHILVHNKKIPRWIGWFYDREPALSTRAWITFHHLDGHRIFDREMNVRWSETDEPFIQEVDNEKGIKKLLNVQNSIDIAPGEAAPIDVIVKIRGEDQCFGWNNESYLYNWHHPQWRLEKGRYIIKVRIKSSGREYSDAFLLVNDVPFEDCRLERLDKEAKARIK